MHARMIQGHWVMSLCPWQARVCKGISHFHACDGLYAHYGHSQLCFQTSVPLHKTAKPYWKIQGNDLKHTAQCIFPMDCLFDLSSHFLSRLFNGTSNIRSFCQTKSLFVDHIAKVCIDLANRGN